MRIRKHTKLCGGGGGGSVLFGLNDNLQTHVCQLNQSPWDVIPFGSDSSLQFDGDEDSFTGNGSRGDSVGATESVASIMDFENQTKPFPKVEDMVVVHDNEAKVLDDIDEGRVVDETISFCQKTDGKNWHCKNEAKPGQSFCDHHLPLLRSYNNNNSVSYNSNNTSSSKKAAAAASSSAAGVRRGKARAAKRGSSSSLATSNRYEFYYYSGFGPLWGKRRGDRHGEGSNNNHRSKNEQQIKGVDNSSITEAEEANEEATQKNTSSPSSLSSSSQMMDNEEFDYGVDDDDEDEDDEEEEANGDGGKKRMRKPVKARSLKSLM
ncbi:hypothetical protein K1719_019078 [Acacia pycnantha]|nr:hypothetical protein K1719_019078 [Acacia pycnantha]